MSESNNRYIKIGEVTLNLVNENDQVINDTLNLTFKTESTIDVVEKTFTAKENLAKITVNYKESETVEDEVQEVDKTIVYSGYTNLISLEKELTDNVYKVVLSKEELADDIDISEVNILIEKSASYLISDEDANKFISIFDKWKDFIGGPLKKLDKYGNQKRISHNEKVYKVKQDIPVVLEDQEPSITTAALYEVIDVEHAGTKEDPIPYDPNMAVTKNKYYIEDGITYKCTRDSGNPLYTSAASQVPHYFEIAE